MTENIKVTVRVRPFLPAESAQSCIATSKNQITIGDTRNFAFDSVYGMKATGDEIYVGIGQPLADAFLAGYNTSTIAYGQTGSGKTFTMSALTADVIQEIFCRLEEEYAAQQGTEEAAGPTTTTTTTTTTTEDSKKNAKSGGGGGGKNGTINNNNNSSSKYSVRVSVLEVYNEALGDLLLMDGSRRHASMPAFHNCVSSTNNNMYVNNNGTSSSTAQASGVAGGGGGGPVPLQLREEPRGGVYVSGLTELEVKDENELLLLVDRATANRKTASTLMNATSSRSHCVVTLTLVRKGIQSRFCFVDLAGSERLKRSLGLGADPNRPGEGVGGGSGGGDHAGPGLGPNSNQNTLQDRMREGISINSGLLALGNVIVALCEKRPHVPYRSSKLTRLLQPMLGGNSRTAMIACVSPHASSLEESLNTLKYADRAKSIKTDPHLVVTAFHSEEEAARTILALHREVEQLREALAACQPNAGATAASASAVPLFPPSDALQEQLREAQGQLAQEQQLVKRLQEDLFNAEYTTMIEVEKRKALEARVAQLEAGSPAEGNDLTLASAVQTREAADARLSTNLQRLQQLEAERDSLRALKAQQEAVTSRLHRELDDGGADADASVDRDEQIADLSEEISAGVKMIAELEKERDAAVRRLTDYQNELAQVGGAKQKLEEELARAETMLEASEAARQNREEEKRKLHDAFRDRIKKAEDKATEYRRRVKQAEQEVRLRTTDLEKTRQLQERVETLREELSRQRSTARLEQLKAHRRSAAHTQEVMHLQLNLRSAETKIAKLEGKLQRKDDEIARTRRKISQWSAADACSRRESHTSPSTNNSCYASGSPTHGGRRDTLPSASFDALPGSATDKTQMAIDTELKCLERLEQELAELQNYRDALAQARTQDRPKWVRALQGFQQHLQLTEQRLAAVTAAAEAGQGQQDAEAQRKRAAELERLQCERKDARHKLSQLQSFQYMFEETALQIAEFDNRIDSLNETRRYHLTQVRQLQQVAAAEVFAASSSGTLQGNGASGEGAGNSTGSSGGWGSATQVQQGGNGNGTPDKSMNGSRVMALPSVREIRNSRKRLERGSRIQYSNNNSNGNHPTDSVGASEYVRQLEARLAAVQHENEDMRAQLAGKERAPEEASPGST